MGFDNWTIIKNNNHTMNTPPLEHYLIIPLRLPIYGKKNRIMKKKGI
jgi:hypothetical protein